MKPRQYQSDTISQIELGKTNLIAAPMRSGKSYIMELAIDHYQFDKVLILVGYRKIVTQLANYFQGRFTHILAGEPYEESKQVHIASFQTLANRDIDIAMYDCIIIDEFHSRMSASVYKLLENQATHLLFTGTPLTNNNRLITKGIDNYIQPVTVKELLESGYITPTRFMSNSTILGDHAAELTTSKQDFDESVVRRIIKKEDLLHNILTLIDTNKLDTEHKSVVYVNFIATADELYELIKHRTNVFVVHSKLSQKQQQQALSDYESVTNGVLINVRALSLGWDSPSTDTIIYAIFTKIHSLALQIMWRASTKDPANPNKVATVYDLVGQLAIVNPYTDFKSYSKKQSCKDQCLKQYADNPMELYFCMEGCKGEPVLVTCNGKQPASHADNPFIYDFQVHSGKPCMESHPSWEYTFKQTDNGIGSVTKWAKCPCGCITKYNVQTLHKPSDMIAVYNDSIPANTVTIIYSKEHHKALALFDDLTKPRYRILMFDSSEELYIQACKFFKQKQFQIIANRPMPKLPNVAVNRSLDDAIPLISWDSANTGFIKKLVKMKLTHIAEYFNIKPGIVYYTSKAITKDNEKSILSHLSNTSFERNAFIKYCSNLQKQIKE